MWLCPLSSFKWEDLAPDCDGFISERCVDFRFVTRMLCPFLCSQQMGIQTLLHMQGQKVCGHRVGSVAQWCHQEPGSPSQPLPWPLGCSHGIHMVASDTIIADITLLETVTQWYWCITNRACRSGSCSVWVTEWVVGECEGLEHYCALL